MAKIYVPTTVRDQVIKVGGVCYEFVQGSANAVTHTVIDGGFETCEDCFIGEPIPCPGDCSTGYPETYTVIVSGIEGSANCLLGNSTYEYNKVAGECKWQQVSLLNPGSFYCTSELWILDVTWRIKNTLFCLYATAPNTTGFPPAIFNFTQYGCSVYGACTGTPTITVS